MQAMHERDLTPPDEPEGDELLEWDDLDERDRVAMCCDVIEGDVRFFDDAMSALAPSEVIPQLRALDYAALGRRVGDSVLAMCRAEVDSRLARGEFLP